MSLRKNLIFLFVIALLSGCTSTKIKDFSSYQNSPILKNSLFDSKKDLQKEIKLVVLEPSENDIPQAKSAKIGKNLAINVENLIATKGLAKILDRSAYKKLQKEIILLETSDSSSEFSGPKTTDYAISGNVSIANLESKYIAATTYYDFANKRLVYKPAQFQYQATLAGNIKVYQMPDLEMVATFPFEAKRSRTENAPKTGNFLAREVDMSALKKEDIGLLTETAKAATDSIKKPIRNFFGDLNRAYIFAKKSHKDHYIFQISMGDKHGIKRGSKLGLYTLQETFNPLNEKTTIEEVKLGEALVSDKINSDSAWIVIKNKKIIEKIRIGDFVKRRF